MSSRSASGSIMPAKGAAALGVVAILLAAAAFAAPASAEPGSVYTTDRTGTNNQNTGYGSKDDVVLTAGGCKGGSRLTAGTYYFEVTDPSTKAVLSIGALADRWFTVDEQGLITGASASHRTYRVACGSGSGSPNDLYVALMPFADTTNHGGEYKLTVAHAADCPTPANASLAACGHAMKKTDMFKVAPASVPTATPTATPTASPTATPTRGPTPTPTGHPTASPTGPTGSVAGVTSPPKGSLPPTDLAATRPARPNGGAVLFLVGLLGALTLCGVLVPVRWGRPRR